MKGLTSTERTPVYVLFLTYSKREKFYTYLCRSSTFNQQLNVIIVVKPPFKITSTLSLETTGPVTTLWFNTRTY